MRVALAVVICGWRANELRECVCSMLLLLVPQLGLTD
jgi:hypothetical protein